MPSSSDIDEKTSHEDHKLQAEGSTFTEKEDAAITRRIDARLLLILGLLYAISLIDCANISVAGMSKDLKLNVGERYSIATLVFFIPYIIFELPSNIVLRRLSARNHLTAIVILWGVVMIAMGFLKTWEQLVVTRVLLGLLETQKRLAVFYLTSMVIAGFANIIGWAITLLGGKHGIVAWQWVFIVFGAATVGLGIIAFFVLVDFPDKNTFLKPEETQHILRKIEADRGDSVPDVLTVRKALSHLSDITIWCYGIMFMCSTTASYAFGFFLPVILGRAFSVKMSLLLAAPPYIATAIYTFAVAFGSDKIQHRAGFIALNAIVCIIGLFVMAFAETIGPRYCGCFMALCGCQANIPAILAYQANNILSHSKRSVSSAVVIGFGGVGGIVASTIFRKKDTPKYVPGLSATIGCQGLVLFILVFLSWKFARANRRVDEGMLVVEGREGFKYTM